MADWEIGEMFLKYKQSEKVSPYCGIEINQVRTQEGWESGILGRWDIQKRNMMVMTDSSYHACQAVLREKENVLGDSREPDNNFGW